jgi:hypothetical protein
MAFVIVEVSGYRVQEVEGASTGVEETERSRRPRR